MNDVAVLKLARNATNVTPIALNNNIDYPSARLTPLNVIGFGATREGGSVSPVLKELGTFFETIESCQNTYPDVRKGVHVCADVANQGDCQGMFLLVSTFVFRWLEVMYVSYC